MENSEPDKPVYPNNLDFPLLEYYSLVNKDDFDFVYPPGDDSYLMSSILHQQIEKNELGQHDIIAQIGSGSGILLAHVYHWLRQRWQQPLLAFATDINIEACKFSQKYYKLYGLPIESVSTSVLNNINCEPTLIICNPPYIPTPKAQMETEIDRLRSVVTHIHQKGQHSRNRDNNLIAFSWVGGDDGLDVVWKLLRRVDWPCTMYFVLIGENPIEKFRHQTTTLGYRMSMLAIKHKYNELLHIVKIQR